MKRIGIIGANGYTGEELLRVLARHPEVELSFASELEPGKLLRDIFPFLPRFVDMKLCSTSDAIETDVDLVFLCLPGGESARVARKFVDRKVKVIDLGADFRFDDPAEYERWYEMEHPELGLFELATYGLPEWNAAKISQSQIVGNPGCYPTSALLGIIPLIRADVVADRPIIIDSKSGVSGAGKSPSPVTHFVEVDESVVAYKPGRNHRHVGEIEQEISRHAGRRIEVVFTPHLIPMSRGIHSTIYIPLIGKKTKQDLVEIFVDAYASSYFVKVFESRLPATKLARNSNLCFLSVEIEPDSGYAIVFSVIDNLGKGASWQAIQNMNLMLGFPDEMGLL